MSKKQNNFNVLIQVQSQNEAERIISIFRGAGLATRAHRITSEEDFTDCLKHDQWHLLVADNRHPQVSLTFSLEALKKKKAETSIILFTDDTSPETMERAFKAGIQDVIDKTADKHFVYAAKREMENTENRFSAHLMRDEFKELSERAEQLLSTSDDAIAYVSDGIIMRCNDKFAEMFGYNTDQLDCASIIDLVAEADHNKFKNFFKLFGKGELEKAELVFTANKKGGDNFESFMTLSNSSLDGEPCTQVNVTDSVASGGSGGGGTMDLATDLFNRYYLADQIAATAMQVNNGVLNASLLVYTLDDFHTLLGDVSLSGVDALLKDLATHLHGQINSGELIARLGDDSVAVILHQKPDTALKTARKTLETIEKHICEFDSRTLQYTCTCVVLNLNNKDGQQLLDQAVLGILDQREIKPRNSADVYTPSAKEAVSTGANDASNIEEAIEQGAFKLLYQPMMSLQGDSHENYEASVWMTKDGQDIYPADLILGAKNSKLDRWIILECTKNLSMHRAGGHNTRLLINLTVNALMDDGLAAWLKVATKAANLTSEHVIFQFDEEDVRKSLKVAIKTITALREGKFRVSIKNFGKEAEPFKLLNHIKIDMVRFDPHFTETIAKGDTAELKELITSAKEASIQTILPDVDNAGALATLWQLGTHFIEGSYLQSPTPVMNYEFADIA